MKKKSSHFLRGMIVTVVVFALILYSGMTVLGHIERLTGDAETETVRRAVRTAALTCYAVEGYYPQKLSYLKDHYGLAYDEETYQVSYYAFASNLIPDIYVLVKGDDSL